MQILVVDDDAHILQLVTIYLTREGYQVLCAENAQQALALLEGNLPDLAVVDVMMPGMDGFTLTETLTQDYDIPVLLLTAKGELEDKERGFLAGSDDYVVKPFEPKELLFRIAAILRRLDKKNQVTFQVGKLVIDRRSFEVVIGEDTLILPLKEFELLALLASRPHQVFTRSYIMEQVWGYDYEGDEQTLNTHVKRIRERLNRYDTAVEITTVRGVGYKLEETT
ncbi:MAG TPA: DNA-binding response regulator [Lysinibacillus sp.]|jgi:two-component system OmpR family response regulator|uniref:response regulator transcription factor n=1 Tax=Lysinibacillus TaxID=400634 RepID=UPI000890314F|nr:MULTISPECIES: response regulator transcription factor [unclassified Lysinibacillus]MEE3808937.1 response regulator transcription factor [Lysinibacillus fusiformis]HBT73523.1 DNA-binding response regulator [Lysinibacillus sp.]WCH47940.1 response regulator transcription factor [Lysinibacillus sp. OF-1]SCY90580.1 DNA-binding response regulator, OmpR family, contains REC and winged-helix (wHTH) domain [Lysinibacillus sp. SG9]SDB43254.1 DNA-binding response regulator, OmpR family, contains REC a